VVGQIAHRLSPAYDTGSAEPQLGRQFGERDDLDIGL